MSKKLGSVWIIMAAMMITFTSNALAQGCQSNGGAITHPGIAGGPALPGHSITITGNLNLVAQPNGTCPNQACRFIYNSTVQIDVAPAPTPVAAELCITAGLGTIPLACGPAPGGTLVPTGVPGQYSAAFNNVTLSAGCGTSFEWTIRLWFDWGGLGGPLVIPVLTALLSCTGC
jgi:hypothetical protein